MNNRFYSTGKPVTRDHPFCHRKVVFEVVSELGLVVTDFAMREYQQYGLVMYIISCSPVMINVIITVRPLN